MLIGGAIASVTAAAMTAAVFAETRLHRPGEAAAAAVAEAVPALPALPTPTAADRAEWALFKAQTVSLDGRIVDNSNHGESHSEGQGVGLLFAVAFDDQEAFDLIHGWTKRNLLRTDGLHAWRWLPNTPVAVPDTNNATDGDIYIAGALQRAARRWGKPDYATAASRTARAIHDTLLEDVGQRLVLLPARQGFVHQGRVSVNLSYYVFPLLAELAVAYPSPRWEQVQRDGVALIEAARFGAWTLPPDWLDIHSADGQITLADGFPARFSYDAVRVPLFLAWSGNAPDVLQAATKFWRHIPNHPPAWVDLKTGVTAEYAAPAGVMAIAGVAAMTLPGGNAVSLPSVANDSYYSAALTLLSRMATRELAQRSPSV